MFLPLEVAEDILFFHIDHKSYGITLAFIQNSKEEQPHKAGLKRVRKEE